MNSFRVVRRGVRLGNTRASIRPVEALVLSQRLASTATQPVEWEEKEVDPQLQGYPQLPAQSYQRRVAGKWDDPQERRNFGEPLPEEHEALSVWSYDHYPMSGGEAVKQLSVAVAVFCGLLGAIYVFRPETPVVRRQYPFSGLARELGDIEENKAREQGDE